MDAVLDWSIPALADDRPRHMLGIGEPEDLFRVRRARHRHVRLRRPHPACPARRAADRRRPAHHHPGRATAKTTAQSTPPAPARPARPSRRAYLRHLFVAEELLAYTLATTHNLAFILGLMARIRDAIESGTLPTLKADTLGRYGPRRTG